MRTHMRDRIRSSVLIDANDCWIWQKARSQNGYGKIGLGGGRTTSAHRASFEAFIGPIPTGLDVCHHCDVRECVNPYHLFAGTRKENIQDAAAKNRLSRTHGKKGSLHPGAKLNEQDVALIRASLAGGETAASISRRFGVSAGLIQHIKHGRIWTHVT